MRMRGRISTRHARLIREGVRGAYLPHRLFTYWVLEPHHPLTNRAWRIAWERKPAAIARWEARENPTR